MLLNEISIVINHHVHYIKTDTQVLFAPFPQSCRFQVCKAWDITSFVSHDTPSPSAQCLRHKMQNRTGTVSKWRGDRISTKCPCSDELFKAAQSSATALNGDVWLSSRPTNFPFLFPSHYLRLMLGLLQVGRKEISTLF